MKHNKIIYVISSMILLILAVAIGPLDVFTRGYIYDEINLEEAIGDLDTPINITDKPYEMHFSPIKNHFAGFEIMLTDLPSVITGNLLIDIKEEATGKLLETATVNLENVKDKTWYKVFLDTNLKKDSLYTLKFYTNDSSFAPSIVTIDNDYLSDETKDGNLALSYIYKKPMFGFPKKFLIFLLLFSLWLYVTSIFTAKKNKRWCLTSALFIFMTAILTANYMFNYMDISNISLFRNFQNNSEPLVTGPMYAERDGIGGLNGYGLGRYTSALGVYMRNNLSPVSNTDYNKGFSKSTPAIVISSNNATRKAVMDAAYIKFENGDSFPIAQVTDNSRQIVITLRADRLLTAGKYGDIEKITFINSHGVEARPLLLGRYAGQYGLQGKVFRHLARYMSSAVAANIEKFHLLCAFVTAVVFMVIVQMLTLKYNLAIAGIFYLTFWLSPWVVIFARNLYWVEFTWFVPMAVGLFCSLKIENKNCRIGCYIIVFIAVLIKCLCGYEYITTIMFGMVSFLLVDLVLALINRNKEKSVLLIQTITILGGSALLGFAAALCIHAPLRANGELLEGLKRIYLDDVVRRTVGGDKSKFAEVYWASFDASVWDVLGRYCRFYTNIISGIPGRLFPILCCAPLVIFAYDYKKKKLNMEYVALYVVFFITSVSWFVLAKAHSYIHTHMNYVLWYFGFVQICLYVCAVKFAEIYKYIDESIKR